MELEIRHFLSVVCEERYRAKLEIAPDLQIIICGAHSICGLHAAVLVSFLMSFFLSNACCSIQTSSLHNCHQAGCFCRELFKYDTALPVQHSETTACLEIVEFILEIWVMASIVEAQISLTSADSASMISQWVIEVKGENKNSHFVQWITDGLYRWGIICIICWSMRQQLAEYSSKWFNQNVNLLFLMPFVYIGSVTFWQNENAVHARRVLLSDLLSYSRLLHIESIFIEGAFTFHCLFICMPEGLTSVAGAIGTGPTTFWYLFQLQHVTTVKVLDHLCCKLETNYNELFQLLIIV